MAKHIEFWTLLRLTQEYISQHYASALTDKNKLNQLKSYIDKYRSLVIDILTISEESKNVWNDRFGSLLWNTNLWNSLWAETVISIKSFHLQ